MNDTKELIITTSMKLFMQKGFKEVTMQEIIGETGLSKGAVYHHFKGKEEIFEEVVKYFYDHMIISDYGDFPRTSLKSFYHYYLKKLGNSPGETDDADEDGNILAFISAAARRVPSFPEIHHAQRKKEITAWTNMIVIAKRNEEIQSRLPNKSIASMFLNLSDGVALNRMFTHKEEALQDLEQDWDNLYKLLKLPEGHHTKPLRHKDTKKQR